MSELIVSIYYGVLPLSLIALTWMVIRRDYSPRDKQSDQGGDR